VFVALDPEGRPVEVPSWHPESEVDRALEDYAVRLGELRREMDAEMDRRLSTLSQSFQVETTGGGAA
jgi:hypothetical protein